MNLDWLADQGLSRLPDFLTAVAIGLLIGIERERNPTAKAGLRTFALVALAGAVSAALAEVFGAPSIVGVGLGAVTLAMIAAYYHHHEEFHEQDPGTTTIVAVVVCYLLSAMVVAGQARIAVMLAILTTVLLYFKTELHGIARGLERRDLVSILQFAVVAFVVLPLLPDRGYGPYAALNPRHIWHMVVLISGVSLAGYVALRIIGPDRSALLLGLLGGLVSSTATTLSFSRRARSKELDSAIAARVIVAANLVLPLRLAVIAAVIAPGVLTRLGPALGTGLIAGGLVVLLGRSGMQDSPHSAPPVGNPLELQTAVGFTILYATVLLLSAWLVDLAGSAAIYLVAAISGLTDVDAITLSALRLQGIGTLSAQQAAAAVVLAVSANSVFKLAISLVVGGRDLLRQCLPAMAAVAAGAWTGLTLFAR